MNLWINQSIVSATCWLVVADSTDLSSRILRNLGNRREMPFSESTCTARTWQTCTIFRTSQVIHQTTGNNISTKCSTTGNYFTTQTHTQSEEQMCIS